VLKGLNSKNATSVEEREERIPTRCNNIDDLLSISDFDY